MGLTVPFSWGGDLDVVRQSECSVTAGRARGPKAGGRERVSSLGIAKPGVPKATLRLAKGQGTKTKVPISLWSTPTPQALC